MNGDESFSGVQVTGVPVKYPPIFKNPGDWVVAAAAVVFLISVFAFPWLKIQTKFDLGNKPIWSTNYGGIDMPWYLLTLLFLVFAAAVAGLFLIRARGGIALGAGICYAIFAVVFFVGAWYKINAIIGDIVAPLRNVPFIGEFLGNTATEALKDALSVKMGAGYWLFIVAAVLFVAGGFIRLAWGFAHREPAAGQVAAS